MSGTDYSTYLRIHELLDLQHPLTEGAHDEMLFVVIHQVYELWFKLILHELDRAVDDLVAGRAHAAIPPLQRTSQIDELLIAQLHVLETMSPDGFLEFRDPLKPASGLQSGQFRAIEYVCGRRDPSHANDPALSTGDRDELRRRLTLPTMYEALCACLRAHGLDAPDGDAAPARELRLAALRDIYREHDGAERALLHQLCELFIQHDEAFSRWRFHHTQMAARAIGTRPGTGGLGVDYLRTTVEQKFFPELWEVRSLL